MIVSNEMIPFTVHCEVTGLYTPEECEELYVVDLEIPKQIAEEFFRTTNVNLYHKCTFDEWYNNNDGDIPMDEVDDLIVFAKEKGFAPTRPDEKGW